MIFRRAKLAVLLGLGVATGACGSGDPASPDASADGSSESVGSITLDLTAVPTGVGCVRITVTGASVVTKDFTLAVNASTSALNMDRLPLGNIVVTGSAYATTCGTGSPIYLADTANAAIATGVVSTLSLTFRKNNPVTAGVNFVGNVQAISAQNHSTYALIDGVVYTWGVNVASAAYAVSTVPVAVSGLTGAVDLSQGSVSSAPCAIKSDGSVWCWGLNNGFQVGVASPSVVTAPVKVGSETGVTMVAAGTVHTCAAEPNGKAVKCWGMNTDGQFGIGNNTSPAGGTIVTSYGASVKSLAAGNGDSCVLLSDFTVACTGYNGVGELGNGGVMSSNSWWYISVGVPKSINAGAYHTCAALVDGTAQCWGYGPYGQVGDGTFTNSHPTPTTVLGLTGVNKLSLGGFHSCALLDSGAVKCWGNNADGELGDNTLTARASAAPVLGIPDTVVMLSSGLQHTCAVTSRQDIYCWGSNADGELGDGTYNNAVKPVKVKLP